MTTPAWHLAQFNIARMLEPLEHPVMAGFVEQLDSVNALAERTPGFVWRLQTEEGDATALRPYEDTRILVNMSVWESIEALHRFTYHSAHAGPFRDRKSWFEPLEPPTLVLWWIRAGTVPTVEEGRERLARLRAQGPTEMAFTFKERFEPPNLSASTG